MKIPVTKKVLPIGNSCLVLVFIPGYGKFKS